MGPSNFNKQQQNTKTTKIMEEKQKYGALLGYAAHRHRITTEQGVVEKVLDQNREFVGGKLKPKGYTQLCLEFPQLKCGSWKTFDSCFRGARDRKLKKLKLLEVQDKITPG